MSAWDTIFAAMADTERTLAGVDVEIRAPFDSGWMLASSVVEGEAGSASWTNPGKAAVEDGDPAQSDTLVGADDALAVVQFRVAGADGNDAAEPDVPIDGTLTWYEFGGDSNLFGHPSVTAADLADADTWIDVRAGDGIFETADLRATFDFASLPSGLSTVTGLAARVKASVQTPGVGGVPFFVDAIQAQVLGDLTASIVAVPGESRVEHTDQENFTAQHRVREWLIAVDDLDFGAGPVEPERGWTLKQTIGAKSYTWEFVPVAGKKLWRWSEPEQQTYRISSQLIAIA